MKQNQLDATPLAAAPTLPRSGRVQTLKDQIRALPRPAWILFAGSFLNKFGAFVIPFLAIYMTRLGYSFAQAGIAIGAYGVGHLAASALGGHLADRIGRRNTIALSMFSAAGAMMLLSQARSFEALVLLTALTGLASELYRPASNALLADLVPEGQRVTAFATYRLAFNAGWAFGPAMAGFLAEYSYFWLFLGDAITSALFGWIALAALPHGFRSGKTSNGWGTALTVLRQDRRFRQLLCASLAVAVVFFQMASTFGLHVTAQGFSPAVYGGLISLNGVLVVLFELPITTITQRFPARRMMALGYVLIGVGFAGNVLAHTVAGMVVVMLIFTLGEMIAMPVGAAYLADLTPAHLRGRYMGLFALTWALALVFGPSLGMALFSHSPAMLWIGCGLLGLLAACIIRRDVKTRHLL